MQIDPFVPQDDAVLGRCHPHPVSLLRPLVQGLGSIAVGIGITEVGLRLREDGAALRGWEVPVAQLLGPLINQTALVGLAFVVLGLGMWGLAWLGWRATEYLVTGPPEPTRPGGHLIRVEGLLRLRWRTIPLRQVNDLGVDLPGWSRLPGLRRLGDWGTIQVIEGNDRDIQTLPYVPHAAAFYPRCQQRRLLGAGMMAGPSGGPAPAAPPSWFSNSQ